jgi:hypothetical protein
LGRALADQPKGRFLFGDKPSDLNAAQLQICPDTYFGGNLLDFISKIVRLNSIPGLL